jgi:hypothetical protein
MFIMSLESTVIVDDENMLIFNQTDFRMDIDVE